ncbi:DoxX family protein [Corynebacterium sp. 335C]
MSDNDKTTDRTTDLPGADGVPGDRPVDASSTTSAPPTRPGEMVDDVDDLDMQLDEAAAPATAGSATPLRREDLDGADAADAADEADAAVARDDVPRDADSADAATTGVVPVVGGSLDGDRAAAGGADETAAAGGAPAAAGTAGAASVPAAEEDAATEHLDLYALTGRAAPKRIEPLPKTGSYAAADADFAGRDEPAVDPDAETTVAPAAVAGGAGGAAVAGGAAAGGALAADPEPARYADDAPGETTVMGAPAGVAGQPAAYGDDYPEDEHDEDPAHDPRRGTLDFGLLLLRLGVGGLLLLHGLSTFFGFGGSAGLTGLQQEFASAGYGYASILSVAVPTLQVIAGGLLVLGLATPLGAGIALALSAFLTMFEVATGSGAGWNILGEGSAAVQVQLLLTASALALQFTGPGRYGLDFSRRWSRRPLASSWIFCILAIAAAVAAWWFVTGTLPFVGTVG